MVTLVTAIKVSPPDWLSNPLSINSSWQIWYRYKGKLVKIMGMNREKNYQARRLITLQLLLKEEEKLAKFGYNPIEKSYVVQPTNSPDYPTDQNDRTTFLDGLNLAYDQLSCDSKTLLNVKSCIKYISASAISLEYDKLPVNQVRRKHIKLLMNHCRNKRNISERTWNAYRAYLMMLFEQLDELELVDYNPAKELKKKKEVINLRTTLTIEEREKVKSHLKENYPEFYRFVQIFFHSGSRRTELLALKVKDVNLDKGEYTTLVKKGNQKRYVIRAIKNIAKQYWEEQLLNADPEHYVFSEGLVPGPSKIREEQVTRRWKRLVKDKLGIKADLYSLKHLNTDETAEFLDIQMAALHNGHTSTAITKRHYAFGEERRIREKLRLFNNEL